MARETEEVAVCYLSPSLGPRLSHSLLFKAERLVDSGHFP